MSFGAKGTAAFFIALQISQQYYRRYIGTVHDDKGHIAASAFTMNGMCKHFFSYADLSQQQNIRIIFSVPLGNPYGPLDRL